MPGTARRSTLTQGPLNILTRYSLEVSQEYHRRSSFTTSIETLAERLTSPMAQYPAFAKKSHRSAMASLGSKGSTGKGSTGKGSTGKGSTGKGNTSKGSTSKGSTSKGSTSKGSDEMHHAHLGKGKVGVEIPTRDGGSASRKQRRKMSYRRSRVGIEEEQRDPRRNSADFDDDVIEVGSIQDASCVLRVESLMNGDDLGLGMDTDIGIDTTGVWLSGKVKLRGPLGIRRSRYMELESYRLSCRAKVGGKSRWVQDMRFCGVWYNLHHRKVVIVCRNGRKLTWYAPNAEACSKWVAALQCIRRQQPEKVSWLDDFGNDKASPS